MRIEKLLKSPAAFPMFLMALGGFYLLIMALEYTFVNGLVLDIISGVTILGLACNVKIDKNEETEAMPTVYLYVILNSASN